MRKIALVILALCAFPVAANAAHHHQKKQPRSICSRAYSARVGVIHRYGKRAPGRNICRYGVVGRSHHAHRATTAQRWRYYQQLRVLMAPPPPYLSRGVGPPAQAPAGTMSSSYAPTGVAACIVSRESGGNPQAVNGQYHGIAQWDHATWIAHGGGRYASDPLGATEQEQLRVLSYALKHYWTGSWAPYDGCG